MLYNPKGVCQQGFPFHKRTSDMRDENDPELQVNPSAVYTVFKEVKQLVKRFVTSRNCLTFLSLSPSLCVVDVVFCWVIQVLTFVGVRRRTASITHSL